MFINYFQLWEDAEVNFEMYKATEKSEYKFNLKISELNTVTITW